MIRFKQILFALLALGCVSFTGCGRRDNADSGKLRVVCGLPPVAFIAGEIGKDRIEVSSMLPDSP